MTTGVQKNRTKVYKKQGHSQHNAIVTTPKNENMNMYISLFNSRVAFRHCHIQSTFHLCSVLENKTVIQCSKIMFQLRDKAFLFQMYFWSCSCQCQLAISYEKIKEPTRRAGGGVNLTRKRYCNYKILITVLCRNNCHFWHPPELQRTTKALDPVATWQRTVLEVGVQWKTVHRKFTNSALFKGEIPTIRYLDTRPAVERSEFAHRATKRSH
jgi:hypothetical protein